MKRQASVRICTALIMLGATAVAQQSQVVGQSLKKLEVPGKISAVLWTRREKNFTLQIVRQSESRTGRRIQPMNLPDEGLQIWLLRADGTQILPSRKWETAEEKKKGCGALSTRCLGYEIQYSFALSAGQDAVAVALRFGDDYLIEKLAVLPP